MKSKTYNKLNVFLAEKFYYFYGGISTAITQQN